MPPPLGLFGLVFMRERVFVLLAGPEGGRQGGATIPLRADLVDEIRVYMNALKKTRRLKELPHGLRLFEMPADMIRIFDKDIAAANIKKRDERDRVVDLHALRHTFGTHLARAGVTPRVAMAAMRHSSIELTMNVYTDAAVLDVAGAVDSLPGFRKKFESEKITASNRRSIQ